jgi:hypothetical protein
MERYRSTDSERKGGLIPHHPTEGGLIFLPTCRTTAHPARPPTGIAPVVPNPFFLYCTPSPPHHLSCSHWMASSTTSLRFTRYLLVSQAGITHTTPSFSDLRASSAALGWQGSRPVGRVGERVGGELVGERRTSRKRPTAATTRHQHPPQGSISGVLILFRTPPTACFVRL